MSSRLLAAMPNAVAPLDALLPPLPVRGGECLAHVAVLEVSEPALLAELAATPKLRRYLLARLSDTAALVDPGQEDALVKALLAAGHTPRIVKGQAS